MKFNSIQSGLADVKGQLEVLLQQCKDLPACEVFKSQYPLDKLTVDRKFLEVRSLLQVD